MVKYSSHALLMSLLNSAAFCIVVLLPTIVDPLLPSRSQVYSSQHPMGYWILLLMVPIFTLTYIGSVKISGPLKKSVFVSLCLLLPVLLLLPNFEPIPHDGVLSHSLPFTLLIAWISFVHHYQVKLEFMSDETIDPNARIARLKIEHETWYRVLSFIILGVAAVSAVTIFTAVDRYMSLFPSAHAKELVTLQVSVMIASAFFFLLLLFLIREILVKMTLLSKSLVQIKRKEDNQNDLTNVKT